jgi:ATP-dependent helicase/nuclease subunit A
LGTVIGLPGAAEPVLARQSAAADVQARVADPAISAWVSANAGTGKTHVLVKRVQRLLLSGAEAPTILCLTFTKAAAAQMANRLMRELGQWAGRSEAALEAEIGGLLGRVPSAEELALARCLFAKVLDAPGGLKIMTIHAFCERVLRRFPLEAGVPPSFTLIAEEEQRAALDEAIDAVLRKAASGPDSEIGLALTLTVGYAAEDRFDTLLKAILGKRENLRGLIRYSGEQDAFARIDHFLRKALGVGPNDSAASILEEQEGLCSDALIASAAGPLMDGSKNDQKTAENLIKVRGLSGSRRVKALADVFLTKDGKARADSSFVTKAVSKVQPGIADQLFSARDRFAELETKRHAAEAAAATLALLSLADAIIARYDAALAARSALDFDSLIARTGALLQRSSAAAWVLYRLDADIAHLLVDEAQDTSPTQWDLIKALSGEFFSGEGAAEKPRTLFAVGDEKQSIYGFQGAEPKAFASHGRQFAARAGAVEARWEHATFTVSRRSTTAVLESVDKVFAGSAANGLTAEGGAIRHEVFRAGEAGLVEIWPAIAAEKRNAAPAWEPFAEEAGSAEPTAQLADRIARQIRHWLDKGEILASQNRLVTPGDILILVRKRKPFADRMVKALKEHGIPVAGADRMRLTEQLAVMDLMVLGDFTLLPEDDLALATLLKTPFFGFDDDDLFTIGHQRTGSLWQALHAKITEKPAYGAAVARLQGWREAARAQSPFAFYAARLEEDGLREKLLAQLGPDATDPLDEFLNLAVIYETSEPPTLQGFLHWLRVSDPEIKRDMEQERDEVRVMTVHGAKGLEAGIVFLADTCAFKTGETSIVNIDLPGAPPEAPKLPVWVVKGAKRVGAIETACEAIKRAEREEYHRLLYVAMTRARDRLYVAGFETGNGRSRDCWYDLVGTGLAGHMEQAVDFLGEPVWRMECPQAKPFRAKPAEIAHSETLPVPDWLRRAVPVEAAAQIVNPSRLGAGLAADHAAAVRKEAGASPEAALARGLLVHRLLEMLPALPRQTWERAGGRLLDAEAAHLPLEMRAALLSDIIAVLQTPDFADVFSPEGRAEVALTAQIPAADGTSASLSGQIDRLIVRSVDVLIVDFKTGSFIPRKPENAPPAYVAQLAAYRAVLKRLFPGKTIRAALLWIDGPALMEFPASLLDAMEAAILPSAIPDPIAQTG